MKVISFNINSIRSRPHQLQAIIDNYNPDFIGLQETKVADEQFPQEIVEAMGYHVAFHGQKSHYGVALMSRHPFIETVKGFPEDTDKSQRRFIGGRFNVPGAGEIQVYNGYFPQGESRDHPLKFPAKQKYYADLTRFLQEQHNPSDSIIVMGDVNVSHQDIDIGIGEDNRKRWLRTGKCSFLPEEREWLDTLKDWGLVDTYRQLHPEVDDQYSWFDYRSRGFEREPKRGLRIDQILATKALAELCTGAGIDYQLRAMEKPSDHCPIWAEFK
ncbi:exodeoxyribonuclease III [Gilvimarinus polysaccharolyticus]|uniref:exodeoxyribonuclease III n=1 Tax=Gilvimarinus polysaccharolyticus TaxID=863921 RepID=UPI0006731C13|nr:exodeoxyribonuclease III [Gilvimarinus polysaccharolyticus]